MQVASEQRQHGLRFSDFRRYRTHCSAKIRNLRRSLGLQQVKNRRYRFIPLPEMSNDVRVFQIALFQAERCWAKAQELLHGPGNLKRRAERRLARAVRHATQLVTLAPDHPETLAYLHALKTEWLARRNTIVHANDSLIISTRILRSLRSQFPLVSAFSQKLDKLDELRKSLNLTDIPIEDINDIEQNLQNEVTIVKNFLTRSRKFRGGFHATERAVKLAEMLQKEQLVARLKDIRNLFIARSFAAQSRHAEAYEVIRAVTLHAEVDENIFPELPTILQRLRLQLAAEVLKSVQLVETSQQEAEAEGLEEEKGEDEHKDKQQSAMGSLVGKFTSWLGRK